MFNRRMLSRRSFPRGALPATSTTRLVTLSVPANKLGEAVDQIADEIAEIPHHGLLQNKEVLNTDLEIMGVGALFRYHGQHNAPGRIVTQSLGRR
jgi:hypothetical protein